MNEIRLPLPDGYGTVTAAESVEALSGAVRYEVRAPHVHGVIVIRPSAVSSEPVSSMLDIQFGDGPRHLHQCDRTSRPVVNGVRLTGGSAVTPQRSAAARARWEFNLPVATGRYTSVQAPNKTGERATAVLRALAGAYCDRPDFRELLRAGARQDAAGRLREERRKIADLREKKTALETEIGERTARAKTLSRLALEYERATQAAA